MNLYNVLPPNSQRMRSGGAPGLRRHAVVQAYYHYVVTDWLEGDPSEPVPPPQRLEGRNHDWTHVFTRDVISMPDKWEFPWFASWDLGFIASPLPTSIRTSPRSRSS